jgi:hypothetical protein
VIAPNAATAAAWGDKPSPRRPKLKKWRPHRSGALLGFCSVELMSGMVINDLRIMTGKNGLWVAMPAQRQLDRDGQPKSDVNGKAIYNQLIEFRDRATSNRFAAMILDLIRGAHPDAFEGDEP